MVHDHWMYRDDDEFTRQFLPGIGNVLGWWERQVKVRVDRPVPWSWSSNASADKLLFSLTLQQSAELFEHFGENQVAAHYRHLAAKINRKTYASQFDPQRGLLRDTPKRAYTQEVNTLAVLADAVPRDA